MKDSLVKIPAELAHPATLTGSDFASPGGAAAGMAEGMNKMVMESETQCGPRHTEDGGAGKSGAGTPVPAMRSTVVAKNFKVGTSMGESQSAPSKTACAYSVDMSSGQSVPNVKMDRS